MNPLVQALDRRDPLRGVRQIIRFNWPLYAGGLIAAVLIPAAAAALPLIDLARGALLGATGFAWLWVLGSVGASWVVYDRSPLMTGRWMRQALGFRPQSWINIHAGFDEMTPALRMLFGRAGRSFDIYTPAEMTEASIVRARAVSGAAAERVDLRRLPAESQSADAVILQLSAHELRSHSARCALFREIRRVLVRGGRVIVTEHLRDLPNFLAFGPGFLHFHSRRTWLRCFADAGFGVYDEFSITPFVRVFILRRTS